MSFKKYTGKARIGLVSGGGDEGYWTFEVLDETSGLHVIDCKISLENFAQLLANRSMDVEYSLPGAHLAGSNREVKREFVPYKQPHDYSTREADGKIALEPFETDGWKGYLNDYCNSHCSREVDGVKGATVGFNRFVDADGKPLDRATGRPL